MIDVVAILRFTKLILEHRSVVLSKFPGYPSDQLRPLTLRGLLLLFLRRHLADEQLLLHPIEKIESLLKGQGLQLVKAKVPFLLPLVMACEAMVAQELPGFTRVHS